EPRYRRGRVLPAGPPAVREVRVRVLRAVRGLPARPAQRLHDAAAVTSTVNAAVCTTPFVWNSKNARHDDRPGAGPARGQPASAARTASTRSARARATRERMVPTGTPSTSAASA